MSDWGGFKGLLASAAESAKKASQAIEKSFDEAVKDAPPLFNEGEGNENIKESNEDTKYLSYCYYWIV